MCFQSVASGLKKEQNSLETLQQGIVQFAGNPFSLFKTSFQAVSHLRSHLPQPQLIERPGQYEKRSHARQTEPPGLVVRWRNRKIQRRALLVPHAAVVAGLYAEAVVARRQICVEGLTAIPGLLPIAVKPFQQVEKQDFFRSNEAERRVIDLQIANEWWQA